jgi:hypothetical protein
MQIFNYNKSLLNNNLRIAIVHLYFKCLNARQGQENTYKEETKYMELYQLSFVFGKYILNEYDSFIDLLNNDYIDVDYFNSKFYNYNNDFMNILFRKIDENIRVQINLISLEVIVYITIFSQKALKCFLV